MNIELSKVQHEPIVKFKAEPGKYYTLLMVDPDAPNASKPIFKHWLHWMIINSSDEIMSFEPSTPPKGSGKHRYFVYLFEQTGIISKPKIHARPNFQLKKFVVDNKLKLVDYRMYKTELN